MPNWAIFLILLVFTVPTAGAASWFITGWYLDRFFERFGDHQVWTVTITKKDETAE